MPVNNAIQPFVVYGALMSLLTTMKGIPLAYNKDMQEDKELSFDAIHTPGLASDKFCNIRIFLLWHDTAELLGFYGPTLNRMDGVSDRDYQIEYLSAMATIMMHLSRFSEEIIIWNSNEYKFVEIDDAYRYSIR